MVRQLSLHENTLKNKQWQIQKRWKQNFFHFECATYIFKKLRTLYYESHKHAIYMQPSPFIIKYQWYILNKEKCVMMIWPNDYFHDLTIVNGLLMVVVTLFHTPKNELFKYMYNTQVYVQLIQLLKCLNLLCLPQRIKIYCSEW